MLQDAILIGIQVLPVLPATNSSGIEYKILNVYVQAIMTLALLTALNEAAL